METTSIGIKKRKVTIAFFTITSIYPNYHNTSFHIGLIGMDIEKKIIKSYFIVTFYHFVCRFFYEFIHRYNVDSPTFNRNIIQLLILQKVRKRHKITNSYKLE